MNFIDINQTLQAPKNYIFRAVVADGAYLRLTYFQTVYAEGTRRAIGENLITVYLNDMGREVGRAVTSYRWPEPVVEFQAVMPRKFRFKNGFLLALQGIQEMCKCLSK